MQKKRAPGIPLSENKGSVLKNQTRSLGIIPATLRIPPECRLRGLNLVKIGLLPPMRVFQKMQELLREI
ncbi:hypothetical protein PITC_043360 [Penicillium italicum]|uniref:Uncharacterized protein n=1 Tax=Penicillium italicum TaxID=40296 RepID=A0A0A2KS74_PENIT|nr:hypothetical protein PITC_043360 [Penicillium italicum]